MQDIVLSARGLTKCLGGRDILHGCNLSVRRGEICCLVGRNGAGKTTLLKLFLGLMQPTAGRVCVLGLDSVRDRAALLRQTGNLIETPVFYEHLSAADNLRIHLAYMGLEGEDPGPALDWVDLSGTGPQPVSEFSLGMRQRLAIARALVHHPEVLILDEPMNELDPVSVRQIQILFRRLSAQGVTILLSSHLLAASIRMAHRAVLLTAGTITRELDLEELRRQSPLNPEDALVELMEGGESNG